jgi:hypothetical protein
MAKDNTSARKARAESIHRQIEALKTNRDGAGASTTPPRPETPAGFVHRRMQDLETEAKKKQDLGLKAKKKKSGR